MTAPAKYTVSILNAKTNTWRTTTETSLAACVALTLGLTTMWNVRLNRVTQACQESTQGNEYLESKFGESFTWYGKKYNHAKRSLFCRWLAKYDGDDASMQMNDIERTGLRHAWRMSDTDLVAQIKYGPFWLAHSLCNAEELFRVSPSIKASDVW